MAKKPVNLSDYKKKITNAQFEAFKGWINSVDPEKVTSICVFTLSDDGTFGRDLYGISWDMYGLMQCELDRLRHSLYDEIESEEFTGGDCDID